MLSQNLTGPTAAYRPAALSGSTISSREWPTLTIYRDGLANLNGLATELLRQAATVALVPPPPTKPGQLAKAWQLHAGGVLPLVGRCDRGLLRFRDRQGAAVLFADRPAGVLVLNYILTPEPGHADRFRLLPL